MAMPRPFQPPRVSLSELPTGDREEDMLEIDKFIAEANPKQLASLELDSSTQATTFKQEPNMRAMPMNFAGATFSGCTFNFSLNT